MSRMSKPSSEKRVFDVFPYTDLLEGSLTRWRNTQRIIRTSESVTSPGAGMTYGGWKSWSFMRPFNHI